MFFSIAIKMATKHFALWTGPLLPCGLAGEKQSAQALAQLITGKEVDGTYHSDTHGCSIDLADMVAFFRDTRGSSGARMFPRSFHKSGGGPAIRLHLPALIQYSGGKPRSTVHPERAMSSRKRVHTWRSAGAAADFFRGSRGSNQEAARENPRRGANQDPAHLWLLAGYRINH